MESIRDYTGEVRVCASCGQPCFLGDLEPGYGQAWQHFNEQWDGVYCPQFPLAGEPLEMKWHDMALKQVKAEYRDARR
ncbi:hypothetical protein ACWDBD_11515 [Streptomyces sp. NPDC001118]